VVLSSVRVSTGRPTRLWMTTSRCTIPKSSQCKPKITHLVIMFNLYAKCFGATTKDLPGNAPSNINYNHHNVCVVENMGCWPGRCRYRYRIDPDESGSLQHEIQDCFGCGFEGPIQHDIRDPCKNQTKRSPVLSGKPAMTMTMTMTEHMRLRRLYSPLFHYDDPRLLQRTASGTTRRRRRCRHGDDT
jgi:hypothetical protein